MSMLDTRFRRCAQVIAMEGMYAGFAGAKTGLLPWKACMPVLQEQKPAIEARRSAGVGASASPVVQCRPPLPRLAFVTRLRYRLLGATRSPGAILNSRRVARRA
jgi:hypothetical protein